MGVPAGIAKLLLEQQQPSTSTTAATSGVYTVLMMGDSILRQLFEALTCGFRDSMTELALHLNVSQPHRRGTIQHFPKGTFLQSIQQQGCHPAVHNDLAPFYDVNVTVPTSLPDCNDEIAMVEFGGVLRIYYVYYPDAWKDGLSDVLEALQLQNLTLVDQLVLDAGYEPFLKYNQSLDRRLRPNVWKRRLHWAGMSTIKETQLRDAGRWFGADNPWFLKENSKNGVMVDPQHGCMPGPPDDHANLFLFMLLLRGNTSSVPFEFQQEQVMKAAADRIPDPRVAVPQTNSTNSGS